MRLSISQLRHAYREPDGSAGNVVELGHLQVSSPGLIAICGPSGAGKTTLVNLMCGMERITSGEVRWDDTEISSLNAPEIDGWRYRNCGLIFQDFHLVDALPPIENILMPLYFKTWSATPYVARANDLIARMGIKPEQRAVGSYSRGERQRIAICRALIFDPPIIIADEPTASLDPANAALVSDMLAALAQRENKMVVVVTHDEPIIERADLRIRLSDGVARIES